MGATTPESAMRKIRDSFESSGLSLEQFGQRMGYDEGMARRAAWQFLNKTSDPRLSMLLRAAQALGADPKDFV